MRSSKVGRSQGSTFECRSVERSRPASLAILAVTQQTHFLHVFYFLESLVDLKTESEKCTLYKVQVCISYIFRIFLYSTSDLESCIVMFYILMYTALSRCSGQRRQRCVCSVERSATLSPPDRNTKYAVSARSGATAGHALSASLLLKGTKTECSDMAVLSGVWWKFAVFCNIL